MENRPEGASALGLTYLGGDRVIPHYGGGMSTAKAALQIDAKQLAHNLGLPEQTVLDTVTHYNDACRPGTFDHATLDDCRTKNLVPPKSHWARPIDEPPYYGYALRPGITFTYLGLKVNEHAAVHFGGRASSNLYAAGEMMAGNVLGKGYTAGVGMSIGTAFGRIAGRQAALVSHKTDDQLATA